MKSERRGGFAEAPDGKNGVVRLYYECEGRGAPLLMLHGNGQDHRVFRTLAEAFSEEYFVVTPDSRGHGRSELGERTLTFSLLAEDARRIMDTLHIGRAFVLGFSDGANAALELAMRCPERLWGAILISGNLNPLGLKRLARVQALLRYHFYNLGRDGKEGRRRLRQQAALVAFQPAVAESRLKEIRMPVLVIAGERDLIREDHTRRMASAIPQASLIVMKNAGHMSLFKKRGKYEPAIREFLDRFETFKDE